MGARTKNFYNDIACKMGFEADAQRIQELYLDGHKAEAAAAVPRDYLERAHLVGPPSIVGERLARWKDAGVTHLSVSFAGSDPVGTLRKLRSLIEEL